MLFRYNEIPHALNREIYTPDQTAAPVLTEGSLLAPADPLLVNDPGHGSAVVSGAAPGVPQDNLYVFAGGTYALYDNMFGRKGYDASDNGGDCRPDQPGPAWSPVRGTDYVGQIQKSVYLVNDACPNAYWNGNSTNYCPGFDVDDVVSHEWSHAYTQYTHGLIYAYQSGALNESYSDSFGERGVLHSRRRRVGRVADTRRAGDDPRDRHDDLQLHSCSSRRRRRYRA